MKEKITNVKDLILLTLDLTYVEETNRTLFSNAFIASFGEEHAGWEENGVLVRVAVPAIDFRKQYTLFRAFFDLFCFDTVSIQVCMPFYETSYGLWYLDEIIGTRIESVNRFDLSFEIKAFFKYCPVNHPTLNIQLA